MEGHIKDPRRALAGVLRAHGFSSQSSAPCVAKFYSKEGVPSELQPCPAPGDREWWGSFIQGCVSWDVSRPLNLKVTLFSGSDLPHAIYFLLFSVQKVQHLLSVLAAFIFRTSRTDEMGKAGGVSLGQNGFDGLLPKGDLTQLHFAREENQQ